MPRTVDHAHRLQLLDRAVDYAHHHGIATLSLRPLAEALGVSPAILLYHFGSKERLIVAVLRRAGDRQRHLFERLRADREVPAGDVCRKVWRIISAADALPLFRLFFEIYGLALQEPERFPGFFPAAVSNWLAFLEPAPSDGYGKRAARTFATVVLAGYRGFLLDLCATHERKRVDAAVEAWIASLDHLPLGRRAPAASR